MIKKKKKKKKKKKEKFYLYTLEMFDLKLDTTN